MKNTKMHIEEIIKIGKKGCKMSMLKKGMVPVMGLLVVFVLAACNGTASAPPPVPTVLATATAVTTAPTATAVAAPSPTAMATPTAPVKATATAAPTATTAVPTPVKSGVQPCKAEQLSGTAAWQGATGSMAGPVMLTNTSSTPCTLQGSPKLEILDAQGQPLELKDTLMSSNQESKQVVLQPKDKARVMLVWRNWCKQGSLGNLSVRVTLPDNGGQVVAPVQDLGPRTVPLTPRCDAPDQPSTLSVGVFEAVPVATP